MTVSRARSLRQLLSGGDRRSIADSNRARELVGAKPARVAELASLTTDDDWLVSMRALDLLEKIAHEQADLVKPYKQAFLGPLADSDKWEIRLQIVRALPLLPWTRDERTRAVEILRRNVEYPQTFVRAWALDSLATFAVDDPRLMRVVKKLLGDFERSGSKALQARARNIRARLRATRVLPPAGSKRG
jgi:HEAT repeat protein